MSFFLTTAAASFRVHRGGGTGSAWAEDVADAYEARVLADYGTVEDKQALIEFLGQ